MNDGFYIVRKDTREEAPIPLTKFVHLTLLQPDGNIRIMNTAGNLWSTFVHPSVTGIGDDEEEHGYLKWEFPEGTVELEKITPALYADIRGDEDLVELPEAGTQDEVDTAVGNAYFDYL